ncbi:hypothetical protein IU469_24835 [Nocardia puris]|uniref:hypothetical protein n=1 Tax=Nocardia puris TaxID=208602 RepID=UPI001894C731|nr:hypothetical protein [Nocardia puris]MBF6368919.1 hypothetical protein [Nocardia puris]
MTWVEWLLLLVALGGLAVTDVVIVVRHGRIERRLAELEGLVAELDDWAAGVSIALDFRDVS